MGTTDVGVSPPEGEKGGVQHLGRKIFIAVLVGLAINVLLGLLVDFDKFKAAIVQAQPWEILVPFLAIIIVYVIDALRYQLVFWQFGVHLHFGDALYNNIVGYFYGNITPSSTGGQPFQIYHFSRLGLDTTAATNVVFSRLMVTNFAQLIFVFAFFHRGIALLSLPGGGTYILGIGMALTTFASILLLFVFIKPTIIGRLALKLEHNRFGRFIGRVAKNSQWAEKISSWSFELRDSFRFLWSRRTWALIADLLLFFVVQVAWSLGLYYPLRALSGVSLPFVDFLFAFIICGLVAAYIPTPGSSGSIEASYAFVLGGLVGSFGPALSAVFLWRLGSYYLHLILGGVVHALVPMPKAVYGTRADGQIERIKRPKPPAAL